MTVLKVKDSHPHLKGMTVILPYLQETQIPKDGLLEVDDEAAIGLANMNIGFELWNGEEIPVVKRGRPKLVKEEDESTREIVEN